MYHVLLQNGTLSVCMLLNEVVKNLEQTVTYYTYIIYCGHCTSQLDTPKLPEAQHAWKPRLQSYFLW